MLNAVIFYFSGTGNTHFISNVIAERLTDLGMNTKCVSIESINTAEIQSFADAADIIGFGYPIYGSDLPAPMKAFIDRFPVLAEQKRAFVFCTQLIFSGDGAFVYKKEIASKSLAITQTAHINMPNNVTMYPMILRAPDSKTRDRIVARGKSKALRFSDAIFYNRRFFNGKYGFLLGITQRGPYRAGYVHLTNLLGVNKETCTKCGRCVRLCPTGNISMTTEYPKFAGKCTLCVRCYNFCPASAIMVSGKAHNTKYRLYKGPVDGFAPEQLKKHS